MAEEKIEVTNNEKGLQFEAHLDGEVGVLQYRFRKGNIALMHTLVPDAIGSRGVATALAQYALEWAKTHNKKVLPYCAFVAAFLTNHPQYNHLVASE